MLVIIRFADWDEVVQYMCKGDRPQISSRHCRELEHIPHYGKFDMTTLIRYCGVVSWRRRVQWVNAFAKEPSLLRLISSQANLTPQLRSSVGDSSFGFESIQH